MLGSISPVGEASRGQRWWITATAYTLASVVGGAAIGVASGLVGAAIAAVVELTPAVRLAALAIVVLLSALVDAHVVPWRLPTRHRQVDETWLTTYRGWVYGAGFGFQLGTGVVTIVPSAVTYAMLAAAVLTTSVWGGLIVGVTFGIVRSVPLLLTVRLTTPARLYRTTQRVAAAEPLAHRFTVAAQLCAAAVAVAGAGLVA